MVWPDLPLYVWIVFGVCLLGGPASLVLLVNAIGLVGMLFERPLPKQRIADLLIELPGTVLRIALITWAGLAATFAFGLCIAAVASWVF
ncbi:hypothetical protein EDC40_103665 [Aminobacter aminovorans]|nr:hypothetical protein EDC40_103665 [Aminobacter aminovorans]